MNAKHEKTQRTLDEQHTDAARIDANEQVLELSLNELGYVAGGSMFIKWHYGS